MKKLVKYSAFMDILLGLNFIGVIAVSLAASITNGDAKLTIVMCTINTFMILICRLTDRREKRNDVR